MADAMDDVVTSRRVVVRRTASRFLLGVWLPVVLLALWWVVSAGSTSPYFPPLPMILDRFWELWIVGDAKAELIPSLRNLAIGFAGGSLLGLLGGVLLWRFTLLRNATLPLLYFAFVLPAPVLLPAMIAIFGIGDLRQIALIAFGATWPVLFNTLDGLRGVDDVKRDAARAMGLSDARRLFSLFLPAAAPQIAAGMRGALQASLILMVISEMVAATHGLGFFILAAQTTFAVVNMWTGILMLSIVGTVLNYLFVFIEHRVLAWHYAS